jgi:hypothetical protein
MARKFFGLVSAISEGKKDGSTGKPVNDCV